MKHAFSSLNKVVDRRSTKDSLNTYRFDFAPFFNQKINKIGHFFTLGGESVDKLSTSVFTALAMLFAYSIFRNLAMMFWVPLLSGGATAFFLR